jgi:hypothetical protein
MHFRVIGKSPYPIVDQNDEKTKALDAAGIIFWSTCSAIPASASYTGKSGRDNFYINIQKVRGFSVFLASRFIVPHAAVRPYNRATNFTGAGS